MRLDGTNAVRPVICEGWHFTHMRKTLYYRIIWRRCKFLPLQLVYSCHLSLKCLYQAMIVSGYEFVCKGYRFYRFLWFHYCLLELFQLCGSFSFYFPFHSWLKLSPMQYIMLPIESPCDIFYFILFMATAFIYVTYTLPIESFLFLLIFFMTTFIVCFSFYLVILLINVSNISAIKNLTC